MQAGGHEFEPRMEHNNFTTTTTTSSLFFWLPLPSSLSLSLACTSTQRRRRRRRRRAVGRARARRPLLAARAPFPHYLRGPAGRRPVPWRACVRRSIHRGPSPAPDRPLRRAPSSRPFARPSVNRPAIKSPPRTLKWERALRPPPPPSPPPPPRVPKASLSFSRASASRRRRERGGSAGASESPLTTDVPKARCPARPSLNKCAFQRQHGGYYSFAFFSWPGRASDGSKVLISRSQRRERR